MSYRSSYTPWKTSLSSGYKSSGSNSYSSRDDVSSTARYSSLASPSSYRPSFSGGTYRLKRDTPIVPASTYVSRYSAGSSTSAVSKPDISINDSSGSKTGQLKRYGSTASNLGKYSREPSPAALEHTNRIKSRDPSPATRSLRGKSRDPSPALDAMCKNGYGSSANSYRLNVPKVTAGPTYGARYGSSPAAKTPTSNTSSASISYLSASDFRARSISKAREAVTVKSSDKELDHQEAKDQLRKEDTGQEASTVEASTSSSETEEEEEKFVSVLVCTRATSPTPPGAATATTVHRTRRIEIAKTIEKTIQRSTKRKKTSEKEIQSDRLDDSTRYSRFGLSARVSSPYTPHTERYTSTSLRYSNSPLSTTSKSSSLSSTSESKKDDASASSATTNNKCSKSPVNTKLKLSPPKSFKINSRQSSVENLSAQKPPAAPKGESPTKSLSSSASLSKLPNKDFRKSALNVGPTDRPRKSRTPSTGTDSDLNTVEALNGAIQAIQRLERSPSAGSEVSNASARSIRRTGTESKLRPKCHNKILSNGTVLSPKSPLSRNNSTTNIKIKSASSSSSSSTPTTTQSSEGSTTGSAVNTTTSSSSGTESCTDNKKPGKKIIKKKISKDTTATTTSSTSTTTSTTSNSSANTHDIKSSIENSFSQQPAVVSVSKSKKSDSSTSRTTPKTPSDKDPLRRLKKLSSVSNFFAAQQQENTNSDEQIYLESSERSSSGNGLERSLSKKSASLTQANETKTTPSPAAKTTNYSCSSQSATNSIDEPKETISTAKSSKSTSSSITKSKSKPKTKSKTNTNSSSTSSSYCPQDTTTVNESSKMPSGLQTESLPLYTTTNQTTSSTSGTDQEESSWWQDTSRQIDTASALDLNPKDEMRFKIRHIDSGETAWWLVNDEDDTLADDLRTLNQAEELEDEEVEDDEEATDQLKSLTSSASGNAAKLNDETGWWANETNDTKQNEDEVDHETNYRKCKSSDELNKTTNNYCVEESAPVEAKPFPRSRLTPETDWWNEENEAENELPNNKNPLVSSDKSDKNIFDLNDKSAKQNGSIKLNICRVESGEKAWWLQEENLEKQPKENDLTVEATIALPKKTRGKPSSSSSSSESKNWWMSGPTKKLFNIQRIESGEKAWWQDDKNETTSENKDNTSTGYRRNNSQEQEWWLDETKEHQNQQYKQAHPQNGGYNIQQQFVNNTEDEPELQQYNQSSYNQSNLEDSQAELSNSFNFEYSERPPPLGQCASPVQQEGQLPTPIQQQQHQRQQSKSPYDNIPMTKVQTATQQPILETTTNFMVGPNYQQDVYRNQSPLHQTQQQYFPHQRQHQQQQQQPIYLQPPLTNTQYNNNDLRSRTGQLFISRHQNIDELLGGSCRPVSPLFYDNGSFQAVPHPQRNIFVEEITPDQVRIHDSTAQMPIIQRMERDDWQKDSLAAKPTTPPRFDQGMESNWDERQISSNTTNSSLKLRCVSSSYEAQ